MNVDSGRGKASTGITKEHWVRLKTTHPFDSLSFSYPVLPVSPVEMLAWSCSDSAALATHGAVAEDCGPEYTR